MTELAQWLPETPGMRSVTPYDERRPAGRELSLIEWAREADAARALAEILCRSPFAPPQFRDNPDHTAAAILAGSELNLSPTASMQAFDVIENRAAPRAITLRALAQANGHELITTTSTETRCVMKGRRRGSNEWQEVTWTIERARKLGVAGKRNWNTQPTAMLVARATSELARLVASDALLGIPYSVEELRDQADADDAEPTTRRVRRRKVSEPTPPAAPRGSVSDEPDEADEQPDPAQQRATGADLRALGAAFVRAGMTTIPGRAAFVAEVLGRDVPDAHALTAGEAARVVEALDVMPTPDQAEPEQLPIEDPPTEDGAT